MPADLDELFSALGAHADQVPLGTPEGARRRARRRRARSVAVGLALVLLGTAGAVATARLPDRVAPPTAPTGTPSPTVAFAPLVLTGTVPMDLRQGERAQLSRPLPMSAIVDGVAYVLGGSESVRLGTLDLATGKPVFPPVNLGVWDTPPHIAWSPAGPVVTGVPAGASDRVMLIIDPASGTVRWQLTMDKDLAVTPTPPAVVTYRRSDGLTRGLDWHTGTELWRREDIPGGGRWWAEYAAGPRLPADMSDAELGSDRMFLDDGRGPVHVLDARTGATLPQIAIDRPRDTLMVIDGILYMTDGPEVWAQPVDGPGEPTLVYRHPEALTLVVAPCGAVLCVLLVDQVGFDRVLLDPVTHRELATVTVETFGLAVGDRFLTEEGRLLGLTGAVVGEPHRSARTWWLTAGSALTVGDPGPEGAEVLGLQTADGTPVLLGKIPLTDPDGCSVDEQYLVCPASDGFHAWRFADAPTHRSSG